MPDYHPDTEHTKAPERPQPGQSEEPGHQPTPADDTQRPRKPRVWSPFLVIRSTPTDNGVGRPLPSSTVFWISPDIWVQSSDPFGNAQVGEENLVFARLFNLGKAHSRPTRVDFYWTNPSLGLGAGDMVYIASEFVEVGHLRTHTVSTPWWPVFENGGHECLLVNCTNDLLDPLAFAFRPTLDRHVGQRNISVLPGKPGQVLSFQVWVNNPAPMMARTMVFAPLSLVTAPRAAGRLTRQDLLMQLVHGSRANAVTHGRDDGQFRGGAPTIRSELSDRSSSSPSAEGRRYFAELLAESEMADLRGEAPGGTGSILHELTLGPFERRLLHLELGVPAGARPGEFMVWHLTQRLEGLSLGGYTIVIETRTDHVDNEVPSASLAARSSR
jgi:hypothetical protein